MGYHGSRLLIGTLSAISLCLGSAQSAQAGERATSSLPGTGINWPKPPEAPKGAPNIVLIMLDDVGFSASSTFGGMIPTPALDKLASQGLRYNRFHSAGVCSPSRAALLTGRNPHQVGMGIVPELAAGLPGYNSVIDKDSATVAKVLKDNGYSTAAFGKWHLNPAWERTAAGPFEHWPTGLGFEHYYGCISCLTEWEPRLFRGTDPVPTPKSEKYDLTSDLVEKSIHWMINQKAAAPSKPFFIYLAPTATHAPVHAPPEWIARFEGKFDAGWDAMRSEVFERQKRLGIIPDDAKLAARPSDIAGWDTLSDNERKLFARQMEVFAGYLAYTDHEVGRLLDRIDAAGLANDTLVFYIVGDNGASAEGGLQGSITNMAMLQGGGQETIEQQLAQAGRMGSRDFDLHFAAGWASAMDTPFPWMKQVASHLGATRNGLVVSWPGHTREPDAMRSQFSYLTDITATIYDAARIRFPDTVDGVAQVPLEGKSLMATLTDPDAPEVRKTQYFAVNSNISLYHDGWMVSKRQVKPWDFFSGQVKSPASAPEWELYNLNDDFSQAVDLAGKNPEKVSAMVELWENEARRNDVLPLNPPFLIGVPGLEGASKTEMTYPGEVEDLNLHNTPRIDGVSHRITAKLSAPTEAEGVIIAVGGRYGGFSLYAKDGKLSYTNNSLNQYRSTITAGESLPTGKMEIVAEISAGNAIESISENAIARSGGFGSGSVVLTVNGREIGSGHLDRFGGMMLNETLDIGKDNGSPVTDDYDGPFPFNGEIESVTVEVLPAAK